MDTKKTIAILLLLSVCSEARLWTVGGGNTLFQAEENPFWPFTQLVPPPPTVQFNATYGLWTTEGGTVNFVQIRNPVYMGSRFEGVACNLEPNVTSPENTTYYFNNIDINYTGYEQAISCRYRVEGYDWNDIPCNGSITRTLPEGYITVTVELTNSICTVSDSVSLTVDAFHAELLGDLSYMVWIALLGLILIAVIDDDDIYTAKEQDINGGAKPTLKNHGND